MMDILLEGERWNDPPREKRAVKTAIRT